MSASWDWPGSRWWRVDLHCHSPASHDFRSDQASSAPDWIGWVEAARDAGLDAVAVTDHNTATGIEHLQKVAAQVENAPVLFPGVELTTADRCHLLLLMDPARERRHIEDLLSRLEVPVDGRGNPETGSPLSTQQVLDRCNDRVIVIAAHVNGPRGLLTEHTGQPRIRELGERRLAAAEVDPAQEIDRRWIDGSLPEVGRQIPEVQSSDSHCLADLGRRHTWVKMTRPDLDGLRLALLDGPGSLLKTTGGDAHDPNDQRAALAIESVVVDSARHMGRPSPTRIDLNPWLNVIIGGRGTGKSTLVDFCRKTLRRDNELDDVKRSEDGALRSLFDRRLRVPSRRDRHRDYSMAGARIRLHMFRNRIELYVPGSLANTLTTDSMADRQYCRNELIVSLLARCPVAEDGLARKYMMERRGDGVPIILDESRDLSGRYPEYRMIDDSELRLIIWAAGAEPAE